MNEKQKEMEIKYDALKAPLYLKRAKLISGEIQPDDNTEQLFLSQQKKLKDACS